MFTLPPKVFPGQVININPISKDEFNQTIPTSFKVSIESFGSEILSSRFLSDDGHLQFHGEPETNFTLTLLTQNTRPMSANKSSSMGECPLGFILINSTCVCSADIHNESFIGIPACDYHNFQALLQVGYWIGCIDNKTVVTGVCPLNFCKYERSLVPIPRRCEDLNELGICANHRRGLFCGECENGYSMYVNSDRNTCGKCEYGALGILAFFTAVIIPLILTFIPVVIFRFKLTSGVAQSFLFFSQVTFITNMLPSLRPLSNTTYTFTRLHAFILGFVNVRYFYLDELSFCLWNTATPPQLFIFYFLSILFSIAFLMLFVAIVHYKSQSTGISCSCLKRIIPRMNPIHNSLLFMDLQHSLFSFIPSTHSYPFFAYLNIKFMEKVELLKDLLLLHKVI